MNVIRIVAISIVSIVSIFVVLSLSVFIHEGGHYITAKSYGMEVTEFRINSGFNLFEKQIAETKVSLNIIPFSGYTLTKPNMAEMSLSNNMGISFSGCLFTMSVIYLLFLLMQMIYPNSFYVPEQMNEIFLKGKSKTVKLFYGSFLFVFGAWLVLPWLYVWNCLVNKKNTYKAFVFETIGDSESSNFFVWFVKFFMSYTIFLQIYNTHAFAINDYTKTVFFVFPSLIDNESFIFGYNVFMQLGFMLLIIFATMIKSQRESLQKLIDTQEQQQET